MTIASTDISPATEAELRRLSAEWSQVLKRVAAVLGGISTSTEDEFLAIGATLQDFCQRALAISGLASEMVGEVAGAKVGDAMDRLGALLNRMEQYANRIQQDIEQSSQTLREILALLGEVTGPLSGFRKVNKVLRMLGISTKIESARLGHSTAGFDSLASDVGELSVRVNEKVAVVLARRDDLACAIGQTLAGVLDQGGKQQERVAALLKKTRASLEALSALNATCSQSVADVSALSAEVSRNIGDVVLSMQSHDIVRQQIEHVEQALSEVREAIDGDVAGADEIACICELQSAQLQHAAGAFEQAVLSVMNNLKEIAGRHAGLSARSSELSGLADQAGGGLFSTMRHDLSVVSDALLESWKVNQTLSTALGSVAETVGEIATYIGDIETIGEEIKLIALNAQIKSAYTGEEGAALGVLAEAIQQLSVDAIDHTGAVSNVLHLILGVTERLTDGIAGPSDRQPEVEGMVTTLQALLTVLRGVNETLRASLDRMDESVTLLSADIEQVTGKITVHRTVCRAVEEAVSALAGIVGEARGLAPASATRVDLDALAGRYTMQSERKVHEALLETGAGGAAAKDCSDEGLGSNVELF